MSEEISRWPPSTGWVPGRVLRKSCLLGASTGEPEAVFRALSQTGSIAPDRDHAAWSFVSGMELHDYAFRIWQLSNGWVVVPPRSTVPRFSLFFAGARTLLGHAEAPFAPALFSAEQTVHDTGDMQWLDTGTDHVALLFQKTESGRRFSLALSLNNHAEAVRMARSALRMDPLILQTEEFEARMPFWEKRVGGEAYRRVRAWALETLIGALRPPEGHLAHRWSESSVQPGGFDLNDLLPLTMSWIRIDPAVAEDLVRCALTAQTANGFIPAMISPDPSMRTGSMMWPVPARCTREILRATGDEGFAAYAIPRLIRFLKQALEHFRMPDRCAWTCEEEAFIPEVFSGGMACVDCSSLLLWEIDALLDLVAQYGAYDEEVDSLDAERATLRHFLTERLWDPEDAVFRDQLGNGQRAKRKTLSRFLPIGADDMPQSIRAAALNKLGKERDWRGDDGLLLWEEWPRDETPPVASARHQAFVLHALLSAGAETKTEWFMDAMEGITLRTFKSFQLVPDDMRTVIPGVPSVHGAALVAALDTPTLGPSAGISPKPVSRFLLWLDQHRLAVFLPTLTLILAVLLSVVLTYLFRTDPTGTDMELLSSIADRHYRDGRYEEAIRLYTDLTMHLPGNRNVHWRLANALFRAGQYPEAETHYRLAMDEEYPEPTILRNLGLSLFHQGRYVEARAEIERLIEMHGERFPRLISDAYILLNLIETREQQGSTRPLR